MRSRALVVLMLFTALRISETVALDVDDVRVTTRKGVLVVLGKGEVQREVPLNALVRQEFTTWTPHWFGAVDGPVELIAILGPHGERLHLHA